MQINKYWSKVSQSQEVDGKAYNFSVWGGSRLSQVEAEQAAQKKLQHVIRHFSGKQPLWSYDYAMSEVREPILEEDPSTPEDPAWVITRNRYGALVLNVARVVFIDIDFRPAGCLALFSRRSKADLLGQIQKTLKDAHVSGVIYETAAGYRLVITDRLCDAASDEAQALMKKFKSDTLYATLCRKHECFRARLSPKPFRINLEVPTITVENFEQPELTAWEKTYTEKSANWSVCKKVHHPEAAQILPEVREVLELHDRFCLHSEKPLA